MSASAFVLVDDGTDRSRWLAARAGDLDGITKVSATDAARIVTGGAAAWATLRREKVKGESFGGNTYTRHGREREAAIAAYAQAEFGLRPSTALIGRAGALHDLATPDGLAVPTVSGLGLSELGAMMPGLTYEVTAFGEYKTTVHDWPTWADVPRRYHWQVVWQFFVTGADECRFIFEAHENFVPLHMEPRVFTIRREDVAADIDTAVAKVTEWREAEDAALPEALLPLDDLLRQHQRAKEAENAAKARVDDLEGQMRALLEAHGQEVRHEGSEANVTWTGKPVNSNRFDSKAFAAKYPRAAQCFTKTSTSRPRLTITTRSEA